MPMEAHTKEMKNFSEKKGNQRSIDKSIDTRIDSSVNSCIDICIDTSIDICIDTSIDWGVDTSINRGMDTSIVLVSVPSKFDFSFEKIFGEELELLEKADQVFENKETVLNTFFFELTFEEIFLDELRFLENKQPPNFHTSTMNLGVEEVVKEELVVRKQNFTNQKSKF